jgi:peptide/nickel transport system permease protein
VNTLRFLIRRILSGILVLWVVATGTFFLFFTAIPVEAVARNLAGRAASPQVLEETIRYYGLNKPVMVQYGNFLFKLLHGNLGVSFYSQEPVTTIIKQDLPATISLVIGGVILWLVAGLAVGILSATRARSLFDRLATVSVLAGISAPTFVVGELLIVFVFVQLNDHGVTFITTGYNPITAGFVPWLGCMILPWITLAIVQAAVYTRLSRGSLLDTLGEDYIRTARSKGLTERRVLYRHAVRSAMTPVVSQLGIDVGALLGGVVVVESVFGLHGLGYQVVTAIQEGDQPTVIGFVIIASLFVVAANIIVDLSYAALDPRVRIS